MDIATADARVVYSEEDIVGGLEGGFGLFGEGYVEGLVQDEG